MAFHSIEKKTHMLRHKARRRMASRQKVTEYYPAPEQERDKMRLEGTWEGFSPEPEPQPEPVDPNNPPKIAIGKNALDGYNAVSYNSWVGPEDMRLREEPSRKQQQNLIDFPHGQELFPLDLIEATAEQRYNWHETVVCFDKAASEAQVPLSIPEPYRTACIEKVRSCNPRLKPSQQECYENMDQSIKQKRPVHLADLVAMLCFIHYNVGESGRNRWLWKKLEDERLLECLKYSFDWGNIQDGVIYDRQGRSMAKKVTLETPAARLRRVKRLPFGAKQDRAKFQRRILHVFKGTNADGVAVYETYHDKFLANQAALAKLYQDQLEIGTKLDEEERAAVHRNDR